jgi:hypothetical protein
MLILFQFFWENKEFFIAKKLSCQNQGQSPQGDPRQKIPSPIYGLWNNNMS